MENSFYITLNSNESNYQADLPQDFVLDGNWVVGLAEISYSKTWFNIPEDQEIELLVYNPDFEDNIQTIKIANIYIPKGHYSNKELVDKINSSIILFVENGQIRGTGKKILRNLELTGEWALVMNLGELEDHSRYFVRFSNMISNMLGFSKSDITKKAKSLFSLYKFSDQVNPNHPYQITDRFFEAKGQVDLDKNLNYFDLKSDILMNNYVNSDNTNILRHLEVPRNVKYGERVNEIFENIYYFPLSKMQFNKINFQIISDNQEVEFNKGQFFITLHFKKVDVKTLLTLEPTPEGEIKDKEFETDENGITWIHDSL